MRSDNRALPALGEACGLTPAEMGNRMVLKARRLGLLKTACAEPNGLSIQNTSTAREVMVALKEALKYPVITEIMSKPEWYITAYKGKQVQKIKILNSDRLLKRDIAQILGGKTGYTDPARYCLAVAARTSEGREVGMVFLGAEGRATRFADFGRVIKWLNKDSAQIVNKKSSRSRTVYARGKRKRG
jgi:D-alanyl-D-alanine endopeptidase (penicillin-binding protein 7)